MMMITELLFCAESSNKTVNSNQVAVLDALAQCAPHMRWDSLTATHRALEYNLKRIVDVCTTTLREPVHSGFKYLAYYVLKIVLKPLVLEDGKFFMATCYITQ